MKTKIPNGGGAFPVPVYNLDNGMSLRDYFAAATLTGISSQLDERSYPELLKGKQTVDEWQFQNRMADARFCYEMADAMLAAREQTGGGK